MSITTWRLIQSNPAQGAWNMAVDEAVLEGVIARQSPPTLRLYSWSPACLSLGYAQPASDVDLHALRSEGWTLVRRPTGGRAILHTDELTYAVIGPTSEPRLTGGVLDSYRRLSQALLRALVLLGLPAQAEKEYAPSQASPASAAVCFEVPSNYEITVNGKKLIGSAQARRREGVLQHGSLPLTGDLARITRVLCFADGSARQQAADRLLQRALTVETALGQVISWQAAAQAFERAFEEVLELRLEPGALSAQEFSLAVQLEKEKYSQSIWTERV